MLIILRNDGDVTSRASVYSNASSPPARTRVTGRQGTTKSRIQAGPPFRAHSFVISFAKHTRPRSLAKLRPSGFCFTRHAFEGMRFAGARTVILRRGGAIFRLASKDPADAHKFIWTFHAIISLTRFHIVQFLFGSTRQWRRWHLRQTFVIT